ncbi:MAG TPA: M48 family metallopeptidase [Zoogloea sp.]|uniref:M48 family metallopeptidase n=1 Tax=Zoogloea sp. TaxID=49181 RepID=UPI002BC4F7F6|nr:M48 family metallopeptidase [Zoogloea sp.]HMV63631.1 M48 family metallopeptidase [Rhodocyclaceae bacterium]HMW51504.1 M48 family metallopeptidase [Rhodocyclaceae bacterium]HMZ76796.1 M48 family metallopeptidase [Rhodocyclaceae bacterium]HNA66117.1 M48 family metallopeptidase [Rhodocyclaceae bacterium]HNB64641.1 M48 family metallopeptidase [Rhodocyclaceae bacterium]
MMSVWKGMLPLGAAVLMVTACQTVQTTQSGAVGVERRQSMLVSSREMEQASAQSYHKILQQAAEKNALNRDRVQVERVRVVARRLIPATGAFRPDAPGWRWEVNVLTSEELNAWCMAGGKIAFYSGIIERLQLSDDEMAAIMGHEIAHALREHARERASQAMVTNIGVSIVGAVLGAGQAGTNLIGQVANVSFGLPNSREQETEADRIGVELAARAGYDPRAAIVLWQKMAKVSNGAPPQWLSTHPSNETRQADLQQYAARVMPFYEEARNARPTQGSKPVK